MEMNIKTTVYHKLRELESQHGMQALLAVESGSRAWGFASENSDYDVRFIYVREPEWYLDIAVEDKRDVIELPISDDLDLVGWDIRKALKLLKKSNPSLLEWLSSPLVYERDDDFYRAMVDAVECYFSPVSSFYHYLSMAGKHNLRYLAGETVRLKTYLYALRALLCAQWVASTLKQPPMEFGCLLNAFLPSGDVREEVEKLLLHKRQGGEVDGMAQNKVLNQYIETMLTQLQAPTVKSGKNNNNQYLNELFQQQLRCYGEASCQ
jgi:predicted nucleotidyltransferase